MTDSPATILESTQSRWIQREIDRQWERNQHVAELRPNRTHSIGHPCARKLTYDRCFPELAAPVDEGLMYVFKEGHWQHEIIRRQIEELGVKILHVEKPVSWKEYQITGTIDLVLEVDGQETIWDAKGYSPFLKIDSIEDLLAGPWYMRLAYAQLQFYLLALGREDVRAGFILKDKGSSRLRFLDCELDLEHAEGVLKKVEVVNESVELCATARGQYDPAGLPDRHPAKDLCEACPYARDCKPPIDFGHDREILVDVAGGALDQNLRTFWHTKEVGEIHTAATKKIKESAKAIVRKEGKDEVEVLCSGGRGIVAKKEKRGAIRTKMLGELPAGTLTHGYIREGGAEELREGAVVDHEESEHAEHAEHADGEESEHPGQLRLIGEETT